MGVAHNRATGNVAVLLQAKMTQVRQSNKEGVNTLDDSGRGFYDTILVLLKQSGDVESAVSITQGSTYYNMYSANQGLISIPGTSSDENYFFAGWSFGFETKYQSLTPTSHPSVKDAAELDYDVYVYKYGFNDDYTTRFLYEEEISKSDMRRRMTLTGQSSIDNAPSTTSAGVLKTVSLFSRDDAIAKERK